MIRHRVQRRTRTPAIPFLRWYILGPFSPSTRTPLRRDLANRSEWGDSVVGDETKVPEENACDNKSVDSRSEKREPNASEKGGHVDLDEVLGGRKARSGKREAGDFILYVGSEDELTNGSCHTPVNTVRKGLVPTST